MGKLLEVNAAWTIPTLYGRSDAPQRAGLSDSEFTSGSKRSASRFNPAPIRPSSDRRFHHQEVVAPGAQRLPQHYYVRDHLAQRMTEDPAVGHELYNSGHMIQGAIAYYRATGDQTLLNAASNSSTTFCFHLRPADSKKP